MSQLIHDNSDEVPLVQAAAELQVSYLCCRDMALRGELEAVYRGRYWFISCHAFLNPPQILCALTLTCTVDCNPSVAYIEYTAGSPKQSAAFLHTPGRNLTRVLASIHTL